MSKTTITSGKVLSLKLDFNFGYTFLKVVNFDGLSMLDLSKGMHLALYSYQYTLNEIEEFDLEDFKQAKELTGPLLTDDILFAIKKGYYKIVSECPLRDYESRIPAMKSFTPAAFETRYEENAIHWKYFEGGSPFQWIKSTFNQVKHLEKNVAYSYGQIATRLTMELLKRKRESIERYYDLTNSYLKTIHQSVLYTTDFDKVKNELKGTPANNNFFKSKEFLAACPFVQAGLLRGLRFHLSFGEVESRIFGIRVR